MKTRVLFIITILIFSFPALTYKNGAPAGKIGSPKSNNNTCFNGYSHGGPSTSLETIVISSDIPSDGFMPNTNYTITVTSKDNGTGASKMGFQSSIEAIGQHQGILSSVSGVTQIKSTDYITHTSGSNTPSSGNKSWNFIWNSSSSPDSVTLYTAGIFANGNSAPSGDVLLLNSHVLRKNTLNIDESRTNQMSVFPNPAKKYVNISTQNNNGVGSLFIYNSIGKTVYKTTWKSSDQDGKIIDITSLSSGFYNIYIVFKDGSTIKEQLSVLN